MEHELKASILEGQNIDQPDLPFNCQSSETDSFIMSGRSQKAGACRRNN